MKIPYTRDEFIAFVLIYTSYADLELDEVEMAFIKSKVGQVTFDKMLKFHATKSEYESLEIIKAHEEFYFPTAEERAFLLDMIKENFFSDGKFSKLEKGLYNFLEHML